MTHYFSDNSDLKENRKEHIFSFYGHNFTFTTDNGVFSKREVDAGTIILLQALMEETIKGQILDLGCGYGVISIILKKILDDADLMAVDINPRAIELTNINSKTNQVEIETVVSNGYENISKLFNVVITNPPIRTGKKVIYQLYEDTYDHLCSGGTFYLVIRRKQGAESSVNKLNDLFGNCEVLKRSKGYWVLKAKKA